MIEICNCGHSRMNHIGDNCTGAHLGTGEPCLCKGFYNNAPRSSAVDHPAHYGGADNPYEAIKIIEALDLGFCLGNALKYISRAGKKPGSDTIEDLKKARWYLDREIQRLEKK